MNEHAVGIDVSKKKLDVCVANGDKIKTKVLKNTAAGHGELDRWLAQRDLPVDAPIVLEATGPYSEAVAIALSDAGWAVSVVNPAPRKRGGVRSCIVHLSSWTHVLSATVSAKGRTSQSKRSQRGREARSRPAPEPQTPAPLHAPILSIDECKSARIWPSKVEEAKRANEPAL